MKENRNIIIGLGLLLLALIVTCNLYIAERRHQQALKEAGQRRLDIESSVLERSGSPQFEAQLYFYHPGAVVPGPDFLVPEKRLVFHTEDPLLMTRQIVNDLLAGPTKEGLQVFSDQAKLRQVYLLDGGTVVVDLSKETAEQLVGGITAELIALHSISRSLIESVSQIKSVKFLVDGQERPTFAGHVSIIEPFM